jgi:biopolymer transport protein ExbB
VIRFLDQWMPWLVDLIGLGGPVLVLILMIAFFIWALLFERIWFLLMRYPSMMAAAQVAWQGRKDRHSWFAQQYRRGLLQILQGALSERYPIIRSLIKICPLLGLLGTVTGMLEVFDAMAATGSNNARLMAAGVSKATVSTLAGMVVAIMALLTTTVIERRVALERDRLGHQFVLLLDGK